MAQWQNLTIAQIQQQIALCDKKIESQTKLLHQLVESTDSGNQNYQFLIPSVNQDILRWKVLKEYMTSKLQELL